MYIHMFTFTAWWSTNHWPLNPFPSVTSEAAPKGPAAPGPTLGRAFFESLDGAPTWAEAPKRPEAGRGLWGDTWKTWTLAEGWMTHTLAYSPATRESWRSFAHEFFCPCGYFHMKFNGIVTHKRVFWCILIPRCLPTHGGGKELVALLPKEAHLIVFSTAIHVRFRWLWN